MGKICDHDLVIAFPRDSTNIKNEHMLCTVHSLNTVQAKDNKDETILESMMVKIVLRGSEELDERNYNLYHLLKPDSQWTLLKVCNL